MMGKLQVCMMGNGLTVFLKSCLSFQALCDQGKQEKKKKKKRSYISSVCIRMWVMSYITSDCRQDVRNQLLTNNLYVFNDFVFLCRVIAILNCELVKFDIKAIL